MRPDNGNSCRLKTTPPEVSGGAFATQPLQTVSKFTHFAKKSVATGQKALTVRMLQVDMNDLQMLGFSMISRFTLLLCGTALGLVLASRPAVAADALPRKTDPTMPLFSQLPAVDGFNGKISGYGGWIDGIGRDVFVAPNGAAFALPSPNRSQALFGATASLSLPVGQRFGLQIDGLASSARGAFVGGGAAHFFTRDPAVGLLGLYGSATRNNAFAGFNRYKLGIEAEAYFGRFTISGTAGWEQTQFGTRFVGTVPGFEIFDVGGRTNRFYDMVDLSYYPTDNWKVSVGHRFTGGNHMAAVGTEYLFGLGGGTAASAFIEGRIGDRNNRAVFGGVSLYFGQKDKTLIRRHREDDPPNRLVDEMFSGSSASGNGGSNSRNRRLARPTTCVPAPANNYCNPPPPPMNNT